VLVQTPAGRFESIAGRGPAPPSLGANAGLAMLLQWSRQPLEVFLDDERSAAARLPDEDRAWLAAAGVNLLVPILGGSADAPALLGALALGPRRSEEPYAPEDRTLLSAIAAQMAVGLDRSRLTRGATPSAAATITTTIATPTLGCCPVCRRCVPLEADRCPDHPGTTLAPVPGLPHIVDGKYRVEAFVGRGGMGAVYRARDLRLERDVAVKVIRAELTASADARARFQREALVVARLQHPAVVAIYDVGTLADGASYLVMEFVRGEDLRQRLARGPLPIREAVDIIAGVAAGVQAAHDAGVFHRDLKPENVLLSGAGLAPKVLDFGVAKLAGPAVTGTITTAGTITGTPAYMAPEQLRGDATAATDVFSLGVMTFEMLTGTLPFGAGSLADIAVAHARGEVGGVERMPDAVRGVVLAALASTPGGRPASPAVFAAALRAALS
jgi:hypothetical protein